MNKNCCQDGLALCNLQFEKVVKLNTFNLKLPLATQPQFSTQFLGFHLVFIIAKSYAAIHDN